MKFNFFIIVPALVRKRFACFAAGLRHFYRKYYDDSIQFVGTIHFHLRLLMLCLKDLLPDLDHCVSLSRHGDGEFFLHLECMLRVIAIENTNVFYSNGEILAIFNINFVITLFFSRWSTLYYLLEL